MTQIRNFRIDSLQRETEWGAIYRATDLEESHSVELYVLGLCDQEKEIAALENYYTKISAANIPQISQPRTFHVESGQAFVAYQSDSYLTLREYYLTRSLDVEAFLTIAIRLLNHCLSLEKKHVSLVYNPDIVTIDPMSLDLKFRGCGIAHLYSDMNTSSAGQHSYEEYVGQKYAYLNQTKKQLASLSFIMLELFLVLVGPSKQLLGKQQVRAGLAHWKTEFFEAKSALLLEVQKHHQYEHDSEYEVLLSVLDLMRKPRSGYRSISGVIQDLVHIAALVEKGQPTAGFELGKRDYDNLPLPLTKPFAREKELRELLAWASETNIDANGLLLLEGQPGIGKSFLVETFVSEFSSMNVAVGTGNISRYANTPYSALVEAFTHVISLYPELLAESTLTPELAAELAILSDLIPSLKTYSMEVDSAKDSNKSITRLFFSFFELAKALSSANTLLLVFEDVHLANEETLRFLLLFYSSLKQYDFKMLLTARDGETHLDRSINALQNTYRCPIPAKLRLQGIGVSELQGAIQDSFQEQSGSISEISKLIYQATQGNPFFIGQYISELVANGTFYQREMSNIWHADLARLSQSPVAENVMQLLRKRLDRQSDIKRDILYIVAMLDKYALDLVVRLFFEDDRDYDVSLNDLLNDGYLRTVEHHVGEHEASRQLLQYTHDNIRQAAKQVETSLNRALIAKNFLYSLKESKFVEYKDNLIGIASIVKDAIPILRKPADLRLAHSVLLDAVTAATEQHEFELAIDLLSTIDPTRVESNRTDYFLALITALYLSGKGDDANSHFNQLIHECGEDQVLITSAHKRRIQLVSHSQGFNQAVEIGRELLASEGLLIPNDDAEMRTLNEASALRLKQSINNDGHTDNLLTDTSQAPTTERLVTILAELLIPSFNTSPVFFEFVCQQLLLQGFDHQTQKLMPYALAEYAIVLTWQGNYDVAEIIGEESLARLSKDSSLSFPHEEYHKVLFAKAVYWGQWDGNYQDDIQLFEDVANLAYCCNDYSYANYAKLWILVSSFFHGRPLDELISHAHKLVEFSERSGNPSICRIANLFERLFSDLRSGSDLSHVRKEWSSLKNELVAKGVTFAIPVMGSVLYVCATIKSDQSMKQEMSHTVFEYWQQLVGLQPDRFFVLAYVLNRQTSVEVNDFRDALVASHLNKVSKFQRDFKQFRIFESLENPFEVKSPNELVIYLKRINFALEASENLLTHALLSQSLAGVYESKEDRVTGEFYHQQSEAALRDLGWHANDSTPARTVITHTSNKAHFDSAQIYRMIEENHQTRLAISKTSVPEDSLATAASMVSNTHSLSAIYISAQNTYLVKHGLKRLPKPEKVSEKTPTWFARSVSVFESQGKYLDDRKDRSLIDNLSDLAFHSDIENMHATVLFPEATASSFTILLRPQYLGEFQEVELSMIADTILQSLVQISTLSSIAEDRGLLQASQIVQDMLDQTVFIRSNPPYCTLAFDANEQKYKDVRANASKLGGCFEPSRLLQIHRSYLVNPIYVDKAVKEGRDFHLVVVDRERQKMRLPVSRSKLNSIKSAFPHWFS